jgi:dolichol-phosphate mannosyltransferase
VPSSPLPLPDPISPDVASPADHPRALVIVPTYNEAGNIAHAIDVVLSLPVPFDVLVIDDGSPDGTADRVRAAALNHPGRVELIERSGKLGLGTAYIRGFRHALERGYELVCEMDADFSHNPRDLPRLVDAVRQGADLAIGSRYKGGTRVINWPLSRLILSYSASVYTRAITRLPVQDVTSGFKCFRRQVLEAIDLDAVRSNGYSFQIEMNFRAWKLGFNLVEVPIIFTERAEGQSKMSKAIVREAAFKVWELSLRSLLGRL